MLFDLFGEWYSNGTFPTFYRSVSTFHFDHFLVKFNETRHFRYRAINTQAKLIILHDYRLFVPRMFYIWRRFINVIFVRQFDHTISQSNGSQIISSFELATVPYPLPIKKVFVTKSLDFWRNGRFRRGGKLTSDKTHNLNGQPMRTVVLKHTPAVSLAIDPSNETIYSGLEVEVFSHRSLKVWFGRIYGFFCRFYEEYHNR